jgi:hypothetical protein
VEGDALYDAGDFLGRGSAIWQCGAHSWGLIVPREARGGVILRKPILRRLGCREGSYPPLPIETLKISF